VFQASVSDVLISRDIMSLSRNETNFLTHFSATGKRLISFEEAEEFLHSRVATVNTLVRLARKGWLQRLERGLYLIIPLEAGPERTWSENSFIIGSQLMIPGAIAYWSAFRFWNWTEQLPKVTFIQTTRRKKTVIIDGTEYRFVTIQEKRFFGVITRSFEGTPVHVTDPEKTLIDAAARPDLCGGIIQLAQAMKDTSSSIEWNKLDQYLVQWGGGAVAKRLGYLIETLRIPIPDEVFLSLQKSVSKGISLLEPGIARKGPVITRWQLQINIEL
jgi:predicted transcriptional regulator of viral defense system